MEKDLAAGFLFASCLVNGIGEDGLTALNLVLPLFNLMNATGLMIGIGGATKYAIHKARGEQEASGKSGQHPKAQPA